MLNFIKNFFGTKSDRDIKLILPKLKKINQLFNNFQNISNDELRNKIFLLKKYIQDKTKDIKLKISFLNKKINDNLSLQEIKNNKEIFKKIDNLEIEYKNILKITLDDILLEVFAIIKETTRRFKKHNFIKVKLNLSDIEFSKKKKYIKIEKDIAVWNNNWIVSDNKIYWDMIYYDVQIIGGIILHQGKIIEMSTGEGKTLVAVLPAFLNALSGDSVHIVTVNKYLSSRDCEWMSPIYEFYGLSVDCIDNYIPSSKERKQAYLSNIVYGTNNEFGFDYLRDNMLMDKNQLIQNSYNFAIIDEVDSVLIDDARTPLVISGPSKIKNEYEYYNLNHIINEIYGLQKKLIIEFIEDAKKEITKNNIFKGGLSLLRAYRGLPKYKLLINYLSKKGVKKILQETENYYMEDNFKMMPEVDSLLLFTIDEKNNNIDLTDKGIDYIKKLSKDINFFILPNVDSKILNIDKESIEKKEKIIKKEKIVQNYIQKSNKIHIVDQLLKAYALFEKDIDYILDNNNIKIIDEQTGRILDGRRYADGLHQAIEAKENAKIQQTSQTYATITLQNYFRMYRKLSGMTGTAETEAEEFISIYNLEVIVVSTNKLNIRTDKEDKIYKTKKEKFNSILNEIILLKKNLRPILVGTASVETSELLSEMLRLKKIDHQVLNAKNHQKEASIIANAGKPGMITIATNMAGRGTDIKITEKSRLSGGLAIIGTERHESRRIDRQLRGRSGRQGDVGSSQFFISLEDNLMRLFGSEKIAFIMDKMGLGEGDVIQHSMINKSIERAQKKVEENNFSIRKRLLEYDDIMNVQRILVYKRRYNALFGKKLYLDILNILHNIIKNIILNNRNNSSYSKFKINIFTLFGILTRITSKEFLLLENKKLLNKVCKEVFYLYNLKNKFIKEKYFFKIRKIYKNFNNTLTYIFTSFLNKEKEVNISINLKKFINKNGKSAIFSLEKIITLNVIDEYWKSHLLKIDKLKQSTQNVAYEQKDPLVIYKLEAFELFKKFIFKINKDIISNLLKSYIEFNKNNIIFNKNIITNKENKKNKNLKKFKTNNTEEINENIKVIKRNQKITVKYNNGLIKKNIKFKHIAEDLSQKKCYIIEKD